MNANSLRAAISFALQLEKERNIQTNLEGLTTVLGQLAGAPNNTQFQTETAEKLSALEALLRDCENSLTPGQKKSLIEVKAYPYFSTALMEEIRRSIAQNAMTPSVTHQMTNKLKDDRQKFLSVLRDLENNFSTVGVEAQMLKPGDAEIAVLLPGQLFNDELDGLQKELRILSQVLRTFYEVSNVSPGPIEVRQISSTDPTLFLGIDITVLVHLGHALKWCIDTVKSIGELKEFIQRAKTLKIDPKKLEVFDHEIEDRVKKSVDEKVKSMLEAYTGDQTRKHELSNSLHLALDQLLQRVERGMTVELRLIPPAKPQAEDEQTVKTQQAFAEASAIAKDLEFPQIQGPPALQLTNTEVENSHEPPEPIARK